MNRQLPARARLLAAAISLVPGILAGCKHAQPLPAPAEFTPARYLGTWHEVARLPVFYQPDDTMATATYGPTAIPGRVSVLNQAYDRRAKPLNNISAHADLAPGQPPGRFKVKFPGIPAFVAGFSGPNYYVIHVDKDYRHAIVGVPSRNALWILSREVPISRKELDSLVERAKSAGFATDKLIIAPWPKPLPRRD